MPLRLAARRRTRSRARGQAVVEFALILPIFMLLTVGVVDMARVFTSYISLTNGVASAALYAGGGGFLSWCSSDISISKTEGCAATNSAQFRPMPGNLAYQIQVEASGLNLPDVVMSKPQCTLALSPFTTGDCTSTVTGIYSTVRISATYPMSLLTPMMTNLMGGPIQITASTSAVVLD